MYNILSDAAISFPLNKLCTRNKQSILSFQILPIKCSFVSPRSAACILLQHQSFFQLHTDRYHSIAVYTLHVSQEHELYSILSVMAISFPLSCIIHASSQDQFLKCCQSNCHLSTFGLLLVVYHAV